MVESVDSLPFFAKNEWITNIFARIAKAVL